MKHRDTSKISLFVDIKTFVIGCWYFSCSKPATAYQNVEVVLPSSQPEYFQGEELPRTSSPFGEYS